MDAPTLILVPLLVVVVLIATTWVVRLVRTWSSAPGHARAEIADQHRVVLEDEKQRLLVTLADLELEHRLGKVDDADYEGLKAYYEAEAVRVIKMIDGLPDEGSSEADEAPPAGAPRGSEAAVGTSTPGSGVGAGAPGGGPAVRRPQPEGGETSGPGS